MPNLSIYRNYLADIAISATAGVAIYFLTDYLLKALNVHPLGEGRAKSKSKNNAVLEALKAANPETYKTLALSEYEMLLLDLLVLPQQILVSFRDIGGLESVVDDLRESILYPLTHPELFPETSILVQAPKGVLLYGPPGCGKTMLAKALARESGANFLSIRMSTIMDKYYGESNKYIDAIFSLARKLQPCIIFVDEIDSFLRRRQAADHEVTANIKAEFMVLWDGLLNSGRILVLGATNRPNDIDEAFLRRMPKRFRVGKPSELQRFMILEKLLADSKVDAADFDLHKIAAITDGYSGSDLKELCRDAVMNVAREYIRANFHDGKPKDSGTKIRLRSLRTSDFFKNDFKPSSASDYNTFAFSDDISRTIS